MTEVSLRIAVADDEPDTQDFLRMALAHLGHTVVAVAGDGRELVELCAQTQPDLIVTDVAMPQMDGVDAIKAICRERPIPAIIVSAFHGDELIARAMREQVLAYLVKPIKTADLQPAISLAMQRYREFEALRRQADDLKQALEDRKVIERAKGIFMTRTGLSEPDAFRRLQLLSSEQNAKLIEVARMIVTADQAFTA